MHTIDLTYVGRGIHEELIAYVADQEGYFEDEGVHVAVRDGIRWETERLRGGATIGLGRTLLSRLTDGIPWNVLAVNTHRPLFWFLGRGEVKSMDDLRGRRLAVHPPRTAPGCLRGSCCAGTVSTPIATCSASHEPRVTTRWICGAFATVRSMRPTWAAPCARTGCPRGGLFGPVLGRRPLPDPHSGNRRGPHSYPARQPGASGIGAGQPASPSHDRRKTPVGRRLHRLVPQPAKP